MGNIWRLPIDMVHQVSGTAGGLTFVGGAGDFDDNGTIRKVGNLDRQITGAIENIVDALKAESCGLDDVVRLKVFYSADIDDWEMIAKLAVHFPDDPMPAFSTVPEPLQPFHSQMV